MKKKTLLLISILILALTTIGCKTTESKSENPLSETGAVSTTMLEGNGAGLWFMLSNGIAESLNKSYKGSIINITPGNTSSNILRLRDNQAELILTHSNLAFMAHRGEGSFEEKHDKIRAVATFYPSYAQFLLIEDREIYSVEEFFEKKPKLKISIGPSKSGTETGFLYLLEAYGYTIEDLNNWGCTLFSKNQTDSLNMISDGAIDGMFVISSAPNPSVVECSTNKDLILLEMDNEKIEYIVNNFGFTKGVIKGGLYKFADKDVESFSSFTVLASSLDTPDETVYKVLKSINDNIDYIQAIHSSLSDLSPEYMANNQTIPMHPGAERYYKEIGLISGD